MSLMPVPSTQETSSCAHCGAALVADQRYCLTCGQPCSPVRLAFLDVLQRETARGAEGQPGWPSTGGFDIGPVGYMPVIEQGGAAGWLRRYSGLLGLLTVLLMCLIVGLLVGHWVSQGRSSSGPQVVEIKGLSGVPAAAAPTATTSTAPTATSGSSTSSAKEEAEESKEASKETKAEKAPPPKPVKVAPTTLDKLSKSTGKQHQEEINALGNQPIETG